MRENFIRELKKLFEAIISMASLNEEGINLVYSDLKEGVYNENSYTRVKELEELSDDKEKEIESLCLKLIFSEQPVASDLRLISASLKMVSDLERISDQLLDIEDLLKELKSIPYEQNLISMCLETKKMVKESVESFVVKDLKKADDVIVNDKKVDDLFVLVKNDIIEDIKANRQKESLVDVLMIAKYLERIGDHSTNIAEWVNFAFGD